MTDRVREALDRLDDDIDALTSRALASPQLNRLREWAAIGPVQRADVQMLVIEVLRLTARPDSAVEAILEQFARWCDEQATSDWYGRKASDMAREFARQKLPAMAPMTDDEITDILQEVGAAWLMDEDDEYCQSRALRHLVQTVEAQGRTLTTQPPVATQADAAGVEAIIKAVNRAMAEALSAATEPLKGREPDDRWDNGYLTGIKACGAIVQAAMRRTALATQPEHINKRVPLTEEQERWMQTGGSASPCRP